MSRAEEAKKNFSGQVLIAKGLMEFESLRRELIRATLADPVRLLSARPAANCVMLRGQNVPRLLEI